MGIRGFFFISLFGACTLLALIEPFAGIVAYMVHYHTAPETTYWGQGLSAAGIRYSFTISLFLVAGTLLNLGRLPYGRLLSGQEVIYLAYLGWMIVTRVVTGQLVETDYLDKALKTGVFLLALTHIVVTPRRYNQFMWLLVLCALYIGNEARHVPSSYFEKGRLNGGVGGPDFNDSNCLAAHMTALLPFIGVQFLRAGWKGKLLCAMAGALASNTVVLTRSRGAFVAILVGIVAALILTPKGGRKKLWPLIALGCLGSLRLVDAGFLERMGQLQAENPDEIESGEDRLMSWEAGLRMFRDHPLGVGAGNFAAHMGRYLPGHEGRDAHNTYVRCAAELGLPGMALFAALVVNAFRTLMQVDRQVGGRSGPGEHTWDAFALKLSIIMYLFTGIFNSLNYIEMLGLTTMLPAALERVVSNALDGPDPAPSVRSRI